MTLWLTFTSTLMANNPKTAPEAPTETEFLGKRSHETRFAPAPVRMYENHKAKFPSSSSTSLPNLTESRVTFQDESKPGIRINVKNLTKYIQEEEIA